MLRPQVTPLLGEMMAAGVARVDTDNVSMYAPGGTLIPAGGVQQLASPLTGATVAMTDDGRSGFLYITPAGTIAALTVNLPSEANSIIGQVERVITSQAITALTVANATTILGNVTTLAAGASVGFMKVAANTWARI